MLSVQFNGGAGWLEYALHMIFQKASVIGVPGSNGATAKFSKATMGSIALLLYFWGVFFRHLKLHLCFKTLLGFRARTKTGLQAPLSILHAPLRPSISQYHQKSLYFLSKKHLPSHLDTCEVMCRPKPLIKLALRFVLKIQALSPGPCRGFVEGKAALDCTHRSGFSLQTG